MFILKIELFLALFHLAHVRGQSRGPRRFAPPRRRADVHRGLDIVIACSHIFFAGHKMHHHLRAREVRSEEHADVRP